MGRQRLRELWSALGWLIFPLVPALLATTYHQTCNFMGPDPREWDWLLWVVLLGPLCGFGFLAGATAGLPDEPNRVGLGAWLSRRAGWVAFGPWMGFLFWAGVYWILAGMDRLANLAFPGWNRGSWIGWPGLDPAGWAAWAIGWTVGILFFGSLAYGWLIPARAAIRRAERAGRRREAVRRGLATMVGFVGSLFGSFWAVTEAWRGYFFDPTVMPILLAASSVALLSGCGNTLTAGEVHRRELFNAMLMAWVLGLALAWRWWSRPGSRPPEE